MTALVVLEGVVIALLAALVVGLLRSHAEILRRLHELGAGVDPDMPDTRTTRAAPVLDDANPVAGRTHPDVPEPRGAMGAAHDIVGTTPDGGSAIVGIDGAANTTLLAFLTSGCGTCAGFWTAFASGEVRELPGVDTRLVVVTRGADRESPAAVASLASPLHSTIMSSDAWQDYAVPAAPYFILIDGPGSRVVGEGAATSWGQVDQLLRNAVADAGLLPPGGSAAAAVPAGRLSARERSDRVARELAAAGIEAGHASLYPSAPAEAPSGTHEEEA